LRCYCTAENFLSRACAVPECRTPRDTAAVRVRNQSLTSGLHRRQLQSDSHPHLPTEVITMDNDIEHRIRHRAQEKWQVAGSPEGRDEEFWHEAEKEVRGEHETYQKLKDDPSVTTNS
jgi:hypothetical protein